MRCMVGSSVSQIVAFDVEIVNLYLANEFSRSSADPVVE